MEGRGNQDSRHSLGPGSAIAHQSAAMALALGIRKTTARHSRHSPPRVCTENRNLAPDRPASVRRDHVRFSVYIHTLHPYFQNRKGVNFPRRPRPTPSHPSMTGLDGHMFRGSILKCRVLKRLANWNVEDAKRSVGVNPEHLFLGSN